MMQNSSSFHFMNGSFQSDDVLQFNQEQSFTRVSRTFYCTFQNQPVLSNRTKHFFNTKVLQGSGEGDMFETWIRHKTFTVLLYMTHKQTLVRLQENREHLDPLSDVQYSGLLLVPL